METMRGWLYVLTMKQGPIAVPASQLPKTLRVQTHVNGEPRQDSTTDDLIFSVANLIKTLSEGMTIQPGDVIATGTPAGVGFGQKPPVWLKAGDVVAVTVTGLGVLKNTVSEPTATNQTVERVAEETHVPISNLSKTCGGVVGLTSLNSKRLHYSQDGIFSGPPIIFIHGLGGSSEYYRPLVATLELEKSHSLHFLDLEGHGLSPTSATSTVSISSYAADFVALAKHAKISSAIVIGHSMGCLVALTLATQHPELVSQLILLGPPPSPMSLHGRAGLLKRAKLVRSGGMAAVVDTIVAAGTSSNSKSDNPLAIAAVRLSLLGQDPEGYAKGCTALAGASETIEVSKISASTLIITGDEDKVSSPEVCENYASQVEGAEVKVLSGVGHWHIFEDTKGVANAIKDVLSWAM